MHITLFVSKRIRRRCWIQHEFSVRMTFEKSFFKVSSTIVHVTFDNIEIKEGWLGEQKRCFGTEKKKAGERMYKYVQEFRLLFTSFLSINIIIFVHTFVKMTPLFACCGWCCVFHYTQWLVSNLAQQHSPTRVFRQPQNVSSEKNEIHENSLVWRSRSDRMWKPERHEHRNSKLIVKAHKTLILWVDFVLKKGFIFQCYLLMHGRSFNFLEISAFLPFLISTTFSG